MLRGSWTRKGPLLLGLTLLSAACDDGPGPGWHRATAIVTAPPARRSGALALDSRRTRAVLFGGVGEAGLLGDSWALTLAAERWDLLPADGPAPMPRSNVAVIADSDRDRILFVGGFTGVPTDEVWALDLAAAKWNALPPGPSARVDAATATNGMLAWVYGGFAHLDPDPGGPSGELADLWQLDLQTGGWSLLPAPPPVPGARAPGAFGFLGGFLYLSGGNPATGIATDTWRYDVMAGHWDKLAPNGGRQAWAHSGYAIDPLCGLLLSVTGDNNDGHPSAGLDALVLGNAPSYINIDGGIPDVARARAASAFDPASGRLALFGGQAQGGQVLGDTWLYFVPGCTTMRVGVGPHNPIVQ